MNTISSRRHFLRMTGLTVTGMSARSYARIIGANERIRHLASRNANTE
jgi:hypothetical protein